MAEYTNLSATINAQIRANGVQAITGPVLNAVLTAMVNVLGDGYRLKGVAVPADNPGSPDNRVAYLAAQDGTYTNFGGLTISGEVALLLWDSAWTKEVLFSIDTAVTPGSGHLVTSGAVDDALTTLAGNIAAAYMRLVPGATEDNLASYDNAGQVKDSGIAAADVVKKDGVYPDLFAGYAGNLVDTRSAGTPQGPYAFRQSGGDGVDYMVRIKGRTEAFNQLVQNGNFADTSIWTTQYSGALTVNSNVGTLTLNAQYGAIKQTVPLVAGHAYLFAVTYKTATSRFILGIGQYNSVGNRKTLTATADGAWHTDSIVWSGTDTTILTGDKDIFIGNRDESSGSIELKNIILVDLTIEGLGLTTAAQFRALHPLPYYNYNAGVLKNNAATGIKTRGRNAWDEQWENGTFDYSTGTPTPRATAIRSKNFTRIEPSTAYYFKVPGSNTLRILWYDANKAFISALTNLNYNNTTQTSPANAAYLKIGLADGYGASYGNDICINLSSADFNGTYEPYWERTLALGLNSIPCHDENNNAVVVNGLDGVGTAQDELIVENGWGTKINKKRTRINLGDLTWQESGLLGDGYYYATLPNDVKATQDTNIICPKYATVADWTSVDKSIQHNNSEIRVHDSAYSDPATFKTAMNGVYLDCELATPLTLTVDEPFAAFVEVDNLGTQERLPADTADNPQGGFESDSNYSVSTANLVRLLNL